MSVSEQWREFLRRYGVESANRLRTFGIEMTPDQVEDLVREALMDAIRENMRQTFLKIMDRYKE